MDHMLDIRNREAEFLKMLHDDSLEPGNDARLYKMLKHFNLADFSHLRILFNFES